MENISIVLGKRIKSFRKLRGLSQEKLAELSGLHSTYIGQIERGEKSPTIESIYKVSVGLDVSISELLKNIGKKEEEPTYADKIYDRVIELPADKQKIIDDIITAVIKF